jgi:hypothetical protein
MALIRHLFRVRRHLFPPAVERVAAPDFVLAPSRSTSPVAVEVTDAGGPRHHAWLDRIAASPGSHDVPSPSGGGWHGDGPRQAFAAALDQAVVRKRDAKTWRKAADPPRWLALYGNINSGWIVSDADGEACLRDQARKGREAGLSALVHVRSCDLVWIAECD